MSMTDFPIIVTLSSGHELLLLSAAAVFLMIGLRAAKKAIAPIQPLLRSLSAVAVVVLAILGALVLVVVAALGSL